LSTLRVPTKRVRELRHNQTPAEKAAWYLLRDRSLGLKFRRQVPIEGHVVDFYCFERRLAIELDGSMHSQPSQIRKDRAKDEHLTSMGIKVLRLPNGLVLEDPEGFAGKIRKALLLPDA
jgi:very-short-patch-repair endonuclease